MFLKKTSVYRWIVLSICFATLTIGCANMSIWTMLLDPIAESFQIDSVQVQFGNSCLMVGYAAGSYVLGGVISARYGRKLAGSIGLFLFMVGTFGIIISTSYPVVLVCRFLQGTGIIWGINVSMAASWFSEQSRGIVSGFVGSGLVLGTGIGGRLASYLWGISENWRKCFLYSGLLWMFLIILYWIFVCDCPDPSHKVNYAESHASDLRNPWKIPGAWMASISLFCCCWMSTGYTALLPEYMFSAQYSTEAAGNVLLWNGMIGMVATPCGGILSDYLIRRGVSPLKARSGCMAYLGFLLTAIVLFLCPYVINKSYTALFLIALLHGCGNAMVNASIGALPADLLGNSGVADKMFGMTCLIGLSGGILVPIIVSAVAGSWGYPMALMTVAAGAAVGFVIGVILPKFKAPPV